HIADVVAAHAAERGFGRLGVLGTRWLVDGDVYPHALAARGLDCVHPTAVERDEVHRIIMDELVHGRFPPEATAAVRRVVARIAGDGCDAVVPACTELPLILDDAGSPLPTLDSTRLLARAALHAAAAP